MSVSVNYDRFGQAIIYLLALPTELTGLIFTTAQVVFITAKITFIVTSLSAIQI